MNKPIGGYFEWEFPPLKQFLLHENAVFLNSGRHTLEYILRGLKNVTCLHIPYYICDAILRPLEHLEIPYSFYSINEQLEIVENIKLRENDYLLYTNYFGIKDKYVEQIVKQYGDRIIVDNAQALYCPAYAKHQIYSPRKYIGMPDGGIAVTSVPNYTSCLPQGKAYERCKHLLKRVEMLPLEGYADFKEVSLQIATSPLSNMSEISKRILTSVDFDNIREIRRSNFMQLHAALKTTNRLSIPEMNSFVCPMVYPYWTNDEKLRSRLIKQQIFVATYWPNVFKWTNIGVIENNFARNLLAIPCDQRYEKVDMEKIIKLINI